MGGLVRHGRNGFNFLQQYVGTVDFTEHTMLTFAPGMGLAAQDPTMLQMAVVQWLGASNALLTKQLMYQHIKDIDDSLWLTGNG